MDFTHLPQHVLAKEGSPRHATTCHKGNWNTVCLFSANLIQIIPSVHHEIAQDTGMRHTACHGIPTLWNVKRATAHHWGCSLAAFKQKNSRFHQLLTLKMKSLAECLRAKYHLVSQNWSRAVQSGNIWSCHAFCKQFGLQCLFDMLGKMLYVV